MKDRIREVRKHFNLTMGDFGERLGVSKDVIANLEYGRVEPTDLVIKAICNEFKVDYAWLKKGIGEMFASDENEILTLIDVLMTGDNETAKGLFRAFAKLGGDEWRALRNLIERLKEEFPDHPSS